MSFYLRKNIENDNFWIYEYEIQQFFPTKREWEIVELDWEKKIFTLFRTTKVEGQKATKRIIDEGYFETLDFKIIEERPDELSHLMVYMSIDHRKLLKPLCEKGDFGVNIKDYSKIRQKIEVFTAQFPDIRVQVAIDENIILEDRTFLKYTPHHTMLIYEQSYENPIRFLLTIGMVFISFVSLIFILSSQGIQAISLFLWFMSVILVNGFVWKTQFQDQESIWEINTEDKTLTIKNTERQLFHAPKFSELSTPLTKIYFSIKEEEERDSEGLFLEYRLDLYLNMEAEDAEKIELLAGSFYSTYTVKAKEKLQEYIKLISPNTALC